MALKRRSRLLVITFLCAFAMVLMERGLYFYTHERLGFGGWWNLWMALGYGLTYIGGALASHGISRRLGERRAITWALVVLVALHAAMMVWPISWLLVLGLMVVAGGYGMIWPVVESYMSAGVRPRETMQLLARFNITWAAAVPLGVAVSGPMISSDWPWLLFAGAGALTALALVLVLALSPRPVHLPADHPYRPAESRLVRYRAMLVSSRWALFSSNALLLIMAPLLPVIFHDLGLSVSQATWSTSIMDIARLIAFIGLGYSLFWYGHGTWLAITTVALPTGFAMIMFGGNLTVVLAGEAIYGLAAGLAFHAALYYAMVVKNASVDAGGKHEALIGVGFAVGPLMGLLGLGLGGAAGGRLEGMALGVGPLLLLCVVGGLWPLRRLRAKSDSG